MITKATKIIILRYPIRLNNLIYFLCRVTITNHGQPEDNENFVIRKNSNGLREKMEKYQVYLSS
jgi:hypothetical protein